MPLSKDQIAAAYPLPAYNFRVDVEGVTMGFAEVSGILLQRDVLTYRHGLSYLEGEQIKTCRNERWTQVSLKKGIVRGLTALREWLDEGSDTRRAVDVHLCDAQGEPVVTWHIAKAVAVKLEAPALDPSDNTVAVETLEIMAAGISLEHR